MAQGDLLLTIADVRGESNDKDLPDAIELSGWSFSGSTMWDPNSGQSTGRVKMSELVVTKLVDISTPILFKFMTENRLISDVKLINRKAGGNRQEGYYRIELTNARVRSIVQKGTGTGATVLEETVSFGYRSIKWSHSQQGQQGALLGGPTEFNWDWDTNQP